MIATATAIKAEPGWRLSFRVAVDPRCAKQSRIVMRDKDGRPLPFPRKYTPQEAVNFRDAVQRAAERERDAQGWSLPWDGPVMVSWIAVFGHTRARKRTPIPRAWRTKKPDAENIGKPLLDCLTRVLWLDDAQVMPGHWLKLDAAQGEPSSLTVEAWDLSEALVPGALLPAAPFELQEALF